MTPLERSFYARAPWEVAPELLNKVVSVDGCAGRVVEVEAYAGSVDAASHAFRGQTARNAVMFGPPGHLYVYFSYGVHWCANVVCWPEATAGAVLLRALAPLEGVEVMSSRRPAARRPRDLCSGPGKLCQALAIDRTDDGADLTGTGRIVLGDDGVPPPAAPGVGPRVGIRLAADTPWRWWVTGDENVSRR